MGKPTIALAMICRNEGHVIARCLRSVRPHISHWCVVDTGSTDDTKSVVQRELEGLPGVLAERPWGRVSDSWLRRLRGIRDVDFSHNRNESLELARQFGTDYLLTIDADEELLAEPGAFDHLDADAYQARFELGDTGNVWPRKLLLKTSYPWAYQDAIHEHLTDPRAVTKGLPGVLVKSHHDSARNQLGAKEKYSRDADVLRRELKRRPNHQRYWFYYAQSLASSGQTDAAIDAYRKRAAMGTTRDEEVFFSLYQLAALREYRGDHWHDVARAYLEAYQNRPTRAEPLWALAALHSNAKEFALGELYARAACRLPRPSDALLCNESVYQYRAAEELAGALAELGRLAESKQILERLITLDFVPEDRKELARGNLALIAQAEAA